MRGRDDVVAVRVVGERCNQVVAELSARARNENATTCKQRLETFRERRRRLMRCLEDLVDQYGAAFLRPHDELGAVIIPTAKRDIALTTILWTDRGRLRSHVISPMSLGALRGEKVSTLRSSAGYSTDIKP